MNIPPAKNLPRSIPRYLWSILLVVAAAGVSELLGRDISPTNLVMVYLLAVMIAAVYLGRGPAVLTSVLSVLVFDFFFVPPRFTMAVTDTQYLLTFTGLLTVGLIISHLTGVVREQAEAARSREAQTAALYELGRDLTIAAGLEAIAQAVISHIGQTFQREVIIFLPDRNGSLKKYAAAPGVQVSDHELEVAEWVFRHDQPAGRGAQALPQASIRCHPLRTTRGVIGVLGIRPPDNPAQYLSVEQRRTLDTFANQVAMAIERADLLEQARRAEILAITEKLQSALLNTISHDLRTPLVSITGALSSLAEEGLPLDEPARLSLIETARGEADRLNRLVGNLLDMSRLEAGAMRIHSEACELQDVIGAALEQLGPRLEQRPVDLQVPASLPLVPLDFVLITRVLVNVIDNAVKYSPAGTPIEIAARALEDRLEITVADHGSGIPPEDLERIFDKFYRVQRSPDAITGHPDHVTGTGLGLSISKGILEVHGGTISAENRPQGGTLVKMTLPMDRE